MLMRHCQIYSQPAQHCRELGGGVCSLLIEMQSYYFNSNDPLSQIPITDIFSIFLLGLVIQLNRIVY